MSELEHKVRCWIYKSARRDGMYLYVREEGNFDEVPDALLGRLGHLEFVMELELHPGRTLARADVAAVMHSLQERGWFLQMPPLRDSAGGYHGD